MNFYRESSPQRDEKGAIDSVSTIRQLMSVPMPGHSNIAEMDYRVTSSSSGAGQADPTIAPKRQR